MKGYLLLFCWIFATVWANGDLPDERSLSDVYFVGAHNSAMSKEDGWAYYQQRVGLRKQWEEHGVRAFKISLHYYDPSHSAVKGRILSLFGYDFDDPTISLCHEPDGKTNCKMTLLQRSGFAPDPALKYFSELASLLEKNPNDVAILMVESYLHRFSEANGMLGQEEQARQMLIDLLLESGLGKHLYILQPEHLSNPWPTLGELREQNKRLIVISNQRDQRPFNYVWFYRENHFEMTVEEMQGEGVMRMRYGGRDTSGRSHFFVMNHFLQVSIRADSKKGWVMRKLLRGYLAKKDARLEPQDYTYINSYDLLSKRFTQAVTTRGRAPNILLIDFVDQGDAQRLVDELNGQ